ncbi:SAM-dependent methyltransferase [Actinokineospora auranticolor]|uniref:S-adenosyl methyltransferase n=1 Tax=Actinokineospora auranticolor TaxID=155976 RepID=A0A2S6GM66_9PSEU|nr:SAM-dependent methyltransferase [Actinokineospora auranticolor]PPK66315.1 S-adenosyl methyltransferase [Actinokineospora auranticolor]
MSAAERSPWDPRPPGASLDFDAPNQARLFDALLGGRDNYAADREVVARLAAMAPGVEQMARDHREWVGRVLRLLVTRRGVDQFLDLGSGLPSGDNTHQIVQRQNPEAKVVYIDNDPVVLAHGRALLEENEYTHMLDFDITRPDRVTTDPGLRKCVDFDRPMAVLLCAVTGHILDDDVVRALVRGWVEALPSGSYLVLSQQYDPADGSVHSVLARTLFKEFMGTAVATSFRERPEIEGYFEGLRLIEPGLVLLHKWWPDGPRLTPLCELNHLMLGALAQKP